MACNQRLFTVFGASNYCGREQNKSGVLIIGEGEQREIIVFPPIPMLKRAQVTFVEFQCDPARPFTMKLPKLEDQK